MSLLSDVSITVQKKTDASYYAPPLGGALSDDAVWRLSIWRLFVCSRLRPDVRDRQRGLGRLTLAQSSPRHTWLVWHHFQGQKVWCQRNSGRGTLWRPPAYSLFWDGSIFDKSQFLIRVYFDTPQSKDVWKTDMSVFLGCLRWLKALAVNWPGHPYINTDDHQTQETIHGLSLRSLYFETPLLCLKNVPFLLFE